MPHVSKKTLTPAQRNDLIKEFDRSIKKWGYRDTFVHNLLTPTERLMLAKRFTAIVMLAQGVVPYRIHRSLGISQMTVARLARAYDRGTYQKISLFARQQRDKSLHLAKFEILLRGGLPPRGRGRWRWLYKNKARS